MPRGGERKIGQVLGSAERHFVDMLKVRGCWKSSEDIPTELKKGYPIADKVRMREAFARLEKRGIVTSSLTRSADVEYRLTGYMPTAEDELNTQQKALLAYIRERGFLDRSHGKLWFVQAQLTRNTAMSLVRRGLVYRGDVLGVETFFPVSTDKPTETKEE